MKRLAMVIPMFVLMMAGNGSIEAQAVRADTTGRGLHGERSRAQGRDHRNWARQNERQDARLSPECLKEVRAYAEQMQRLEQRLHREHETWHRAHDDERGSNWVRQHNALHERLDQTRAQWERAHRPPRCRDSSE